MFFNKNHQAAPVVTETSVDKVMESLNKAIQDLNDVNAHHASQHEMKTQEIAHLQNQAKAHKAEADRALKVQENIKTLLGLR